MFISVIVTSYNRIDCLEDVIAALLSQEGDHSENYEVIIVDNNSTDGTRERLQEISTSNSRLRFFHEEKQGQAYAINKGLENAKGDVIALTDHDNVVSRNWISTIAKLFEDNPDIKLITGKVFPIWRGEVPLWYSDKIRAVLAMVDHGEERKTVRYCIGSNVAYRRCIFDEFGVFEGGSRYPDVQYAEKIRPYISFNYFPELIVYHFAHTDRLNKSYFKNWQKETGALKAMLPRESQGRTFLHIELWRYRKAILDLVKSLVILNDPRERFYHYLNVLFFVSYFNTRQRSKKFKS